MGDFKNKIRKENMDIIANTNCGKIRGKKVKENILRFTGIPFATPPVGELRFKAPVGPEPWSEVKDTTEFGPTSIKPYEIGRASCRERV